MLGGVPCTDGEMYGGGGGFFMRNRLGKCMLGGVPCTDGEMYGGGGGDSS
jgi:hypothetical protein